MYSFAFFTFYGYITNSQSELIAQSVEHCTDIAEVTHAFESRAGLSCFELEQEYV